jgi:phosphatidylinositol glycan class V
VSQAAVGLTEDARGKLLCFIFSANPVCLMGSTPVVMNSISSISKHPYRQLVAFFAIWKTLLLGVAALSPGPGYDTSTSLVLSAAGSDKKLTPALLYLIEKLTRWDAIYFTQASRRGYLFEQEWAFGWGFTRVVSFCAVGKRYLIKCCEICRADLRLIALRVAGVPHYEGLEALIAIIIAHAAHLASVLVLFHLSLAVFPGFKSRFALTTATLHIVSPAGLFLSAPYAESSCALFTFSGALLFAKSFVSKGKAAASHDLFVLASGILFGISTTFRSNGILSGLLLLEEAFRVVISLKEGFETAKFRRLILTGIGGMCVGAGFFVPQFIAYNEYCGQENALLLRPWCGERIPSIYTFVQEHYW